MGFADFYFTKYALNQALISEKPANDLNMVITIPCFNEQHTIKALEGLYCCIPTLKSVEVIILINYPESQHTKFAQQHADIYTNINEWANDHNTLKLKFYPIIVPLSGKQAGVGFARKLAMDEALRRFNLLENPKGIIVGYDADCTCDTNYLFAIESFFVSKPKADGCSIFYEHPIAGNEYEPEIYNAIIQYELYLRYYIEGLRKAKYPFAYHTLGSSFAVTANAYALQGGMNRRKAGEDFYFLHKIIPLGNFFEINNTRVIPSPRTSDRVPFGTGAAVTKIIENNQNQYLTHNPAIFDILHDFFKIIPELYQKQITDSDDWFLKIHYTLKRFLIQNNFASILKEINANCSKVETFNKRVFVWFNGLMVLQYLNDAHTNDFLKIPIEEASIKILGLSNIPDSVHLLELFRIHQKKEHTITL
jgi:hypothetical protein